MAAPAPSTVAAVELGGTKIVCGVASRDDPAHPLRVERFPTTGPDATLTRIEAFLRDAAAQRPLTAIGVASFGPLDVEPGAPGFGRITDTPKEGWSGTSLFDGIPALRAHPTAIMTDVSAAALAEHREGAAAGHDRAAYLTVGTGIGAGIVIHSELVHGNGFPEAGHLIVRRHPQDRYGGCCRLHGDCVEGLASGPAVRERWGVPGDELRGETLSEAVEVIGYYLAQVVHAVHGIAGSQVVVLGGGVMNLPGLFDAVGVDLAALRRASGPDPSAPTLVRPAFEDAGLVGGLVAASAL